MPAYDDQNFHPPAPIAMVDLASADGSRTSAEGVPVLLDTGADITLLPSAAVQALGVDKLPDTYAVEGFDGRRSEANAVQLTIRFLGRSFRGRFLLIDQPIGILGRNVLNHVRLILDGPNGLWSEQARE